MSKTKSNNKSLQAGVYSVSDATYEPSISNPHFQQNPQSQRIEEQGFCHSNEFQLIATHNIKFSSFFYHQQSQYDRLRQPQRQEEVKLTADSQKLEPTVTTTSVQTVFNTMSNGSNFVYEFTAISPTSIKNNDIVFVTYHSSNPNAQDWIGVYSPSNIDIKTTVPVKYGYCDMDKAYLKTGRGTLTFNMTNLRQDLAFYYFTGGLKDPIVQTQATTTVSFTQPNQPLRSRIVPFSGSSSLVPFTTFMDASTTFPVTATYAAESAPRMTRTVATTTVAALNLTAQDRTSIFELLWNSLNSAQPVLKWGLQSNNYAHIVHAKTITISQNQMCGPPANSTGWRDFGLTHTALFDFTQLTLQPQDKVYYIYGDASSGEFSQEFIFYVPPKAGEMAANHRPTTVVLYDDMGRGSDDMAFTWNEYGRPAINVSKSVGHLAQIGAIDAILHGGDISYARGMGVVWDFFLNMISPMASAVPYLSIVGNHEVDYPGTSVYYKGTDSGGECGVPALTFLPEPYPATIAAPWWSYDIGLIHFVSISTEHDFRRGSAQYAWLVNDLKSINRTLSPWVVFSGHRPMYVNSKSDGRFDSDQVVARLLRSNLEDLLLQYKVNLAVYGHNHVYQRHSAVYKEQVVQRATRVYNKQTRDYTYVQHNPQATVHMVVGTAGAPLSVNAVSGETYPTNFNCCVSKCFDMNRAVVFYASLFRAADCLRFVSVHMLAAGCLSINLLTCSHYLPAMMCNVLGKNQPKWNELFFYQYGYTILRAYNSTYLYWEWVNASNNRVLDKMVITQASPYNPFVAPSSNSESTDTMTYVYIGVGVGIAVLLLILLVLFIFYKPRSSSDTGAAAGGGPAVPNADENAVFKNKNNLDQPLFTAEAREMQRKHSAV